MSIRDLVPPRRIAWRSSPQPPAGDLPPITLITPCLDRAGLVGMAIESAWAQGYPALRHIVVDGGSTDGTLDVLAGYPNVEVVAQRSKGSHPAMNEGLARADGEVVAFLNTDDLLLPGVLQAAGRAFAEYAAYATEVIEDRRRNPQDDLITLLAGAKDRGVLRTSSEDAPPAWTPSRASTTTS